MYHLFSHFSFLFYLLPLLRHLHSFPTRRSSDLVPCNAPTISKRGRPLRSPKRRFIRVLRRSEEHTSELQSPCNLVCRLLLEKKNKYYYNMQYVAFIFFLYMLMFYTNTLITFSKV